MTTRTYAALGSTDATTVTFWRPDGLEAPKATGLALFSTGFELPSNTIAPGCSTEGTVSVEDHTDNDIAANANAEMAETYMVQSQFHLLDANHKLDSMIDYKDSIMGQETRANEQIEIAKFVLEKLDEFVVMAENNANDIDFLDATIQDANGYFIQTLSPSTNTIETIYSTSADFIELFNQTMDDLESRRTALANLKDMCADALNAASLFTETDVQLEAKERIEAACLKIN